MMRRSLLIFSLVLVFVVAVSACSKKQTTDLPETDPEVTEVATEVDHDVRSALALPPSALEQGPPPVGNQERLGRADAAGAGLHAHDRHRVERAVGLRHRILHPGRRGHGSHERRKCEE